MKDKMVKVPIAVKRDSSGKFTFTYADISIKKYEAWLKRCYELGS